MRFISQIAKANLFIKVLALTKIPLMFFCRPKIVKLNDDEVTVKIRLKRRTKNHVKSMYIGVLVVGADLAGAYLSFHHVNKANKKIKLIFKDFQADFLKRAEGDVYFTCIDGQKIQSLVEETISTGERCNCNVNVIATVPSKSQNDTVATFKLTLSIK